MTTIAFDGRYLAADGRSTQCGMITGSHVVKIFPFEMTLAGEVVQVVLAGAGTFSEINQVVGYFKTGADPLNFVEAGPDDPVFRKPFIEPGGTDMILIVKRGDGVDVMNVEADLSPFTMHAPLTTGSGSPFALTALQSFGQNAVEAVYTAMDMDAGTGGHVLCFDTKAWDWIDADTLRSKKKRRARS